MKTEVIHITLKNGETIELREACIEDAKAYRTVSKIYSVESEFIPYGEGEFKHTIEDYEKRIQEYADSKNSILILAVHNERIVGAIDVNGYPARAMEHAACIEVGMLKEYQNLGLGKALFSIVIDWAKKSSPLELIWLSVFSSHKRGIALYRKMGFEECGRMKDFFKKEDNTYHDDVTMILNLTK